MPCPYPILVKPSKTDSIQAKWPVPCGQCKWCRVNRKLSWIGRMRLELASHGGVGRFVTLTYRDDASGEPWPDRNADGDQGPRATVGEVSGCRRPIWGPAY